MHRVSVITGAGPSAGPDDAFTATDARRGPGLGSPTRVALFGRLDARINNAGITVGLGPLVDLIDATLAARTA